MEYPIFEQKITLAEPCSGQTLCDALEQFSQNQAKGNIPTVRLTRSVRDGQKAVTVHFEFNDKHFTLLPVDGDDPRLFFGESYTQLRLVSLAIGGLVYVSNVDGRTISHLGEKIIKFLALHINLSAPVVAE